MFGDCTGPIWRRDDFTPCFQRDYLQNLLPLLASVLSFGYLAIQSIRRTAKIKRKGAYQPIKLANATVGEVEDPGSTAPQFAHALTLHPTISRTNDSVIEVDRPRGETVLVATELLALLGEVVINFVAIRFRSRAARGAIANAAGLISWCYILTLALLRVCRLNARWKHIPKLWNHTAVLYGINWVMTVLLFRSALVHPRSNQAQALMIVDFVLVTGLALIALTSRKGNKTVALEHEEGIEPSKEPLASVLSLSTFSWVDGIVWHGFWNTYEISAVWNLMARDKAAAILADYKQLKKTSRLAFHLLKYFKRRFLNQGLWAVLSGFLTFVPTIILKLFLEFVEDPEATPVNAAWFYIILLALSSCVQAVASGQALWMGRKISIQLRAVIIGEIYTKSLRRKAAAGSDTVLGAKKGQTQSPPQPGRRILDKLRIFGPRQKPSPKPPKNSASDKSNTDSQVNVGTIINLMAVDSFKVGEVCAYLHFLWASTPVQLLMCVILLYRVLGYSSFVSIALMMAVMPLNLFIAKQFSKTQKIIMATTDARIHTTNEVLQNIRIIKYFAWEVRFGQIVNEKRRAELKALRRRYILWTAAATVWFGVPLLITFFSFMIYTLVEKKPLIPSVAFTALSLFSILRIPLDQLADMVAHVQECKVSVDRVEEFLNEEETEKYTQLAKNGKNQDGDILIGFDNATFTWGGKDSAESGESKAFRMIDLHVKFSIGALNLVVGPTGSGKTSLLMALLGEMTKLRGTVYLPGSLSNEDVHEDPNTGFTESVAYCAQQAWLVNDTIKQNILFASPPDDARYKSVISACALERDLQILDAGDQTLAGEKGITLSGGQKQRISLARALYCNSRHILLDDCLSAVDSHTAKHIFEQCIQGPLMVGRTCILVTHNTALCLPAAEHVVYLKNGKIAAQGSPDEVIATGILGEDQLTSKPSSKFGTRVHSRAPSFQNVQEESSQPVNGHVKKQNGGINGSAHGNQKGSTKKEEQDANARTESKAEGGVKKEVIKLYLAAMGPWWYWVLAVSIFLLQQFGSVLPNIWIRQWANSYQVRNSQIMDTMRFSSRNHYALGASNSFSASCLSGGTCAWSVPLLSKPAEVGVTSASAEDINVPYYLGIYAALAVFYVMISMFREALIFWGSLVASWTLHQRLLEAVTRAKFKFFDSTPSGQMMNRFSKDVEAIDQEVAPIAVGVVGCLTSVITIIILISVITPAFLIAAVFITGIYFGIGAFYIKSSVGLKRLESVQKSPLYQQFGETLSGITTIRAYGHERRFIRDNLSRVDKHNRPYIYLWAANRWLAFRVDVTGALVSFFAGVFIILRIKTIDAGAAGLSMTYAVMFSENILWLVRLYSVNEQNMNSVERVKEYMDVEQEAQAIKPDARPPGNWPSQGTIEFINYSTRYRSDLEPVLKNLTFRVQPSERVGIVGRTGAGKSSLAMALFRGLEAEEGKIVIDDVDIGLIGLQDLRESITIVPQDPTLFTGTIRSNLDPFGLFTDEEIFSTLRRVQLIGGSTPSHPDPSAAVPGNVAGGGERDLTLTKTFTNSRENTNIFESLASPVAESGSNLSQGQRQLLCLARALLKAPKVLLMDEATASIDYATDSKIQDTLREVKSSTIITIAHRLQTIIDYDKVLVLDKGKLMEYGAPWELISQDGGIFRGMCEMSGDLDTLTEEANKASKKRQLIEI